MNKYTVHSIDELGTGKTVALYGAGDYGYQISDILKSSGNVNVSCFIDTYKDGGGNGVPIINLENIDFSAPDFDEILITADSWVDICLTLLGKGFEKIRIVRIGKEDALDIKKENPLLYLLLKGKNNTHGDLDEFLNHAIGLCQENERRKSDDCKIKAYQDENTYKDYQINLHKAELESIKHHNAWQINWIQWRYMALLREYFGQPEKTVPPVSQIPEDLTEKFSMNGLAEITYKFVDGSRPGNYRLIYTDGEINAYIEKISKREYGYYGQTDIWLYEAIERYPIKDKSLLIIGSICPWYESIGLYYGGKPCTVDYNGIITRTDRIRTMTTDEFEKDETLFESSFSISSIEHDGLGAYGDPLNPDADIHSMKSLKKKMKKGSLLYFSVPVGKDKVIFNQARVYGKHRLPRVLDGWEVVASFGYSDEALNGDGSLQPVFVLRNV